MQTISWNAFVVNNALTKTIVHFLPASSTTNAPYTVNFSLTLFSADHKKTVNLDGGRLGQPDGVRLEDLFPALSEGQQGMSGVVIELSTAQPKVDVSASTCVVEFITAANSVRYFAKRQGLPQAQTSRSMLAIKDAYNYSSLVIVNAGDQACLFKQPALPAVQPYSVLEYNFEDSFFSQVDAQECAWGLFRAKASLLEAEEPHNNTVSYALYRDTLTKRIVSIYAL